MSGVVNSRLVKDSIVVVTRLDNLFFSREIFSEIVTYLILGHDAVSAPI